MKLVFYGGGDNQDNIKIDQELLNICQKKKKLQLAFIPSCAYMSDQEFNDIIDHYKTLGVKKFLKIDIDSHYSETLKNSVLKSDIIHLGGGNTYYFLKYLKKNNWMNDLKDWIANGGILTGLSAGAILMTRNIETAGFPEFDKDDNEENIKNLNAMNLVNFEFFPHYKNSKRYDQELLNHSLKTENPVYACADGSGIIVLRDEIRFIGKAVCFYQGTKNFISK